MIHQSKIASIQFDGRCIDGTADGDSPGSRAAIWAVTRSAIALFLTVPEFVIERFARGLFCEIWVRYLVAFRSYFLERTVDYSTAPPDLGLLDRDLEDLSTTVSQSGATEATRRRCARRGSRVKPQHWQTAAVTPPCWSGRCSIDPVRKTPMCIDITRI